MRLITNLLLILCIFLLLPAMATAQDCQCPLADLKKLEQLRDENDTLAARPLISSLKGNADKNCQVFAYTLEAWILIANKKTDSALPLIIAQEKLVNSLPCKDKLAAHVSLNYSRYYKRKNDFENMSSSAFKALAQAETAKNKEEELAAIQDLVYVFTRQNEDEKIPAYVKRAEKIITSLPVDYSSARYYNWLAFEYETHYTRVQRMSLVDSGYAFAEKAIAYGKQFFNPEQLTQSFRAFEAFAYHRGNIRLAVSNMDSALFYAKQIKVATNLGPLYLAKASDLLDLGEKTEAMRWADTSIRYVERDFKGTQSAINVYLQASQIYEAAGSPDRALASFKTYEHLKDSLFTLQRSEKINELEQQYNKAKNEKTIRELAQQKRIYILLAVAGLFALIGLIFFIRQQALCNKQKILETEQRLNRARMNPHFFFNALSSLQSFALQGNDGKSIATNLSKFSHIMRETLESTYKEYVTIEQEKDFLEEYLELQKIRFPQKFTYELTVDPSIEPDETLIPSMILQPFVENSIEHGFTGIDYAGHISLQFARKDNSLHIQITDNGKGLATTPKENSEHISRASQIIKDRIYLLNIKLKTKASFSIDNAPGGKGVLVNILLPLMDKGNS